MIFQGQNANVVEIQRKNEGICDRLQLQHQIDQGQQLLLKIRLTDRMAFASQGFVPQVSERYREWKCCLPI
jgi:hypothetical protein